MVATFKVVLDGFELDDGQSDRVRRAIQQTVIRELADFDSGAESKTALVLWPQMGPHILGLIMKMIEPHFLGAENEVGELAEREFGGK